MQSLTGLDSAFIHAETDRTPMNVTATILLEPDVADPGAVIARLEERIGELPALRRRLVEVPFGLDHPVWVEDESFDLRSHVLRIGASPAGDRESLARVVEQAASRRLERSRPLWELWIVDRLEEGRIALVFRAHHALLDGVSGAAMLVQLFDRPQTAKAQRGETGASWAPDQRASAAPPNFLALMGATARRLPGRTVSRMGALSEGARSLGRLWTHERNRAGSRAGVRDTTPSSPVPVTPFNGAVGRRRTVAYARASMDDVQRIREAFGGTVNDVVLSACAASLRQYLGARGGLPDHPLRAAIPISTRDFARDGWVGNRLSAMLVELPTQEDDPNRQLSAVRTSSIRAKRRHAAMGGGTLAALAELDAFRILRGAVRLYSGLELANRHAPVFNVTISSVPGPERALSLCGARVEAMRPHGPLIDGVGLNITLLSYAGQLDVGVLACAKAVADPLEIAEGIAAAIERLAKRADRRVDLMPELPSLR